MRQLCPNANMGTPVTTAVSQVLAIVYGGNASVPGAFYPNGATGTIH